MGQALPQCDVLEVFTMLNGLAELRERCRREIQSGVTLTMWRNLREQQSCSAANLQHTPRPQFHQARHRFINPLLHLMHRNRGTGVTAVPTDKFCGAILDSSL